MSRRSVHADQLALVDVKPTPGHRRRARYVQKVTPKASRVAGFIILWALAMKGEGRDGYTISEFQRYYNENERKAYRDQAEFRELWPEFETPNELAGQILPQLRGKLDATKLPSSVMVVWRRRDGEAHQDASSSGLGAVALEAPDRGALRILDALGRAASQGRDAVAAVRWSSEIQSQ